VKITVNREQTRREVATDMKHYIIAARAAKPATVTVIAAVCLGAGPASYFAATTAPAVASAAAHTTIGKVVPRDNPWPGP
jgi:hypothetical protein